MNLVLLDTNAFYQKDLLLTLHKQLQFNQVKIYISPIIYLELGYICYVRKRFQIFKDLLLKLQVTCTEITARTADLACELSSIFKDDPRGSSWFFRDCLIGATAKNNDLLLITNNLKDFSYLRYLLSPDEYIAQTNEKA